MLNKSLKLLMSVTILSTIFLCSNNYLYAQGGKEYGIFAPKDAYPPGSIYPYYGSENEWSRRMFTEKRADVQYKRRGQRQMLAIIEGKPSQAIEYCRRRLREEPHDPEPLYMMAVAFSKLNKVDSAFYYMMKSISSGIPFSRFLAGPKSILRPLYESNDFKDYYEKYPEKLVHGPMLGNVTDSSAQFWLRTFQESDLVIKVFEKPDKTQFIFSGKSRTSEETDYTTVVTANGLKPGTDYFYQVFIDNKACFNDGYLSFSTSINTGKQSEITIAFGGGAGFTPKHERIWEVIASHDTDGLFLLGDNVYIDLPGLPNEFHNFTYYRRQSQPQFASLVKSTPVYAIWDDHDCAMDDVWMGPFKDKPAWKIPNWQLFKNNWNNPAYGSEDTPGCWFKKSIGDVDFFFLDGRNYRTCPFDSTYRTMLGEYQKDWLLKILGNSKATFKVLISPVPWSFDAKPGSKDTWAGFPEEREEIFKFIEDRKIEGVVLLSADRHRTDAWKIERQNGYDLYEFQSSRLTNIHTHELMEESIIGYNEKCSFGHLTFNTAEDKPNIKFKIINIDSEVIDSLSVTLKQLGYGN